MNCGRALRLSSTLSTETFQGHHLPGSQRKSKKVKKTNTWSFYSFRGLAEACSLNFRFSVHFGHIFRPGDIVVGAVLCAWWREPSAVFLDVSRGGITHLRRNLSRRGFSRKNPEKKQRMKFNLSRCQHKLWLVKQNSNSASQKNKECIWCMLYTFVCVHHVLNI